MLHASIERKLSAALIACALAGYYTLTGSSAHAALIAIGGGVAPTPVSLPVVGTVVFPGVPVAFSSLNPDGFSGTLTSTVVQESLANNPLGGLTFVYDVHNNITSVSSLERLTISDFAGFATDVSYAPAGQAPTDTLRVGGIGAVLAWDFTGPSVGLGTIAPGADSAELIVRTDAPAYELPDLASVIDDATVNVATIGPSSTVQINPEPASLGVLFVGALGLRRVRRMT